MPRLFCKLFAVLHNSKVHRLSALLMLLFLPLSLSCARLPPSVSGFTGRRLRVTMTFSSTMQSGFFYYFLLNKYGPTGTQNANGPVPVFGPVLGQTGSFGNGYATSSSSSSTGSISGLPDYGITDFVLFHSGVPNGIGLYHYTDDPNKQQTPPNYAMPFNVILPSASDPDINSAAGKTLQFDLYISQLVTDTTDQAAKNQEAQNIEWLQVNMVATNVRPTDPTSSVLKEVDAFGNTLGSGTNSSAQTFLTIHLTENRTYSSSDNVSNLQEPINDVYPGGNSEPSLDLQSWSIQVIPN